jgi:hypothetical protein
MSSLGSSYSIGKLLRVASVYLSDIICMQGPRYILDDSWRKLKMIGVSKSWLRWQWRSTVVGAQFFVGHIAEGHVTMTALVHMGSSISTVL